MSNLPTMQPSTIEEVNKEISLHRDALGASARHHDPDCSMTLSLLAAALLTRFRLTKNNEDLIEAISLNREALELRTAQHPERSMSLSQLAAALHNRFHQISNIEDLTEAISLHREALELRTAQHPERSMSLSQLAAALHTRFLQTSNIEDVIEAISLNREALKLRPSPHPKRHTSLRNLANTLSSQSHQTGNTSYLNEAISLHREALKLLAAPHPDRSDSLVTLGYALAVRFDQSGNMEYINESISLYREALELRLTSHPKRSESLDYLASGLILRFKQGGSIEDINESILLNEAALRLRPVPHSKRSSTLDNLAIAYFARFGQRSSMEDMNEAISLHREALVLRPARHRARSSTLSNLSKVIITRFGLTRNPEDMNEAVLLQNEALVLRPHPHPDRSDSLHALANILNNRFHETGDLGDVNDSILLHREALGLLPYPHPDRSMSLHSLGNALIARFRHTRNSVDLNEAISLYREALELRPVPHPERPATLGGLAISLSARLDQTGNVEDENEAILLHREALCLYDDSHPHRSISLHSLANGLSQRFRQTQNTEDLNQAILLFQEALGLRPAPHPRRPLSLYGLAGALRTRFLQTGGFEDMDETLALLQEALLLLPPEHPETSFISFDLGRALMTIYSQTQQSVYQDHAMDSFRAAVTCQSAAPSTRFDFAVAWAYGDHYNDDSTLEAYRYAIQLLPLLAMLGLDLQSRKRILASKSDGIARDAACCAIRLGHFDEAVEMLEGGRVVFWSQALQLRTPLDKLYLMAPVLAEKLQLVSRSLEQGALRDISSDMPDSQQQMALERESAHYNRLNKEWLVIVEEVRQLDGFQDFLLPKSIHTLRQAASSGPIVILNISDSGCDALIVTSSRTRHVALPEMTLAIAQALVQLLRRALFSQTVIPRLPDDLHALLLRQMKTVPQSRHGGPVQSWAYDPETILQTVLAMLWTSAVEPVIRALGLEKSETPPRLWWCPTGPFTFLPLHAAGLYDQDIVSDYVVSSYTPTLSALLTPIPLVAPDFKVLVAIQPEAPGCTTLTCARGELLEIEKVFQHEALFKLGVGGVPASVQNVLSLLSDASIAHFACHGMQDIFDPFKSGLILDSGEKLEISQFIGKHLPKASLVFLSACETAMGDENLPDEAMHLAASMLFIGFHGAVATMWSMADEDGPKIAKTFYRYLFRTQEQEGIHVPDVTLAARALHLAVRQLREEGCSFTRWVPFIHIGQ